MPCRGSAGMGLAFRARPRHRYPLDMAAPRSVPQHAPDETAAPPVAKGVERVVGFDPGLNVTGYGVVLSLIHI